jgi:subtilisin-like proprotein convertase family protein
MHDVENPGGKWTLVLEESSMQKKRRLRKLDLQYWGEVIQLVQGDFTT